MLSHQFLYDTPEDMLSQLSQIDGGKPCLIQLFTNELLPQEAVALAQQVQTVCPKAHIIGTSVSGVIYQGEQYDNRTLVVAEQYDHVTIATHMVSLVDKSYQVTAKEMDTLMGATDPALMRLFVGGYHDYAHQMIEEMNDLRPQLKIVGGMAGELHLHPQEIPFIFDTKEALSEGLVFATLLGASLKVYGRINTAHEPIGDVYTITDTRDRAILAIEGEPAQAWLQRNFGVLSTKEYKTWEDIAQNDPLVRLQLALEGHHRSIRFIHYDETTGEISQYFSRLPAGSKFRISYTSPSKCAEESRESCSEVASTPIEHLFCYSCLFRKLYLQNCSKWELSPFHENPVSGVFLLGEFGFSEEGNTLLNGSCVLSGVAEQEHYLSVDMSRLDSMDDIRNEDEKLMSFILRKQQETATQEHLQILEEMITHESNHHSSPYQRLNLGVSIGDMNQYEVDKEHLRFNKLCMARIENADIIISQRGQLGYFTHLKMVLEQLATNRSETDILAKLHFYSIKESAFLVASNSSVDRGSFMQYIHALQQRCDKIQKMQTEMPFLMRFVLVRNHPYLLERSYAIMESCQNSQLHVVVDEHFEDGELTPVKTNSADELAGIQLIQYALEHDGVVPHYQGVYNNHTGQIDRYEALMRLRDSEGQIFYPNHFMDIAKKYRLYLDLNLKMLQTVLRDFSQMDEAVSVNLSVHDMLAPSFCQEMRRLLNIFPNPANLTLELLEDDCVSDIAGVKEFISEVRSYGVKIAVDDFGAGYSNLLEVINIKPDYIKIDGQIISNIGKTKENESILEAVALLGQRLSIELVAEFVETAEIQSRVIAHGIHYSQGYHFSVPQPFDRLPRDTGIVPATQPAVAQAKSPTCSCEDCSKGGYCTEEDREFFHAMQAISSDLLFRLNLRTGQMRHFGAIQEQMGVPSIIENFPQGAMDADIIAKEDIPATLQSIALMRQGIEKPGYFRIYNRDRVADWYRMDYKVIFDKRNIPTEVIGKLTNIQQQKDLENQINTDPMTGCLRKIAFESLAIDYMQKHPSGQGILFIIDLDNFKSVNDNLGHQFGDRVLRGVGDKLRAIFRGADYVGRIGGDEFMVMMVGTNDLDIAKRKATDILSALDATYTGAAHAYHVSASIGIGVYPQDGADFKTLYDHADMALFDAKNRGKNGFVVYHNTLSKGTMENTLPFEVAARTLAQHYDSHVVEETFNLLFETKELEISLQAVLELIGKRFEVSRCYIFEQHPDLIDTYQNTYEWCNNGITEEKWRLDAVPLELFEVFFEESNSDGVLYCNDLSLLKRQDSREIMEAQNIKSFLHTYITSGDQISYIIGMDECDTPRVWTPIEVSTILQASKIIVQFLSYKKALQNAHVIAQERLSVLDSLNYYAYIINRHTYELIFFNEHLKNAVPDIALGQTCYSVLRGKDAPCEDCPLEILKATGETSIRSVISGSILSRNLLTLTTLQRSFAGCESACMTAIPLDDMDEIVVKENIHQ